MSGASHPLEESYLGQSPGARVLPNGAFMGPVECAGEGCPCTEKKDEFSDFVDKLRDSLLDDSSFRDSFTRFMEAKASRKLAAIPFPDDAVELAQESINLCHLEGVLRSSFLRVMRASVLQEVERLERDEQCRQTLTRGRVWLPFPEESVSDEPMPTSIDPGVIDAGEQAPKGT